MISVREIETDDNKYMDLARRSGSVFNQPGWLRLYGSNIVLNGLFNLNDELIGAFSIFKATKFGLSYLIVPPYSPSISLFFNNPAESNSNRISFEKAVHDAVCDWFTSQQGFLKIAAFPPGFTDFQPYFWKGWKVIPNYTYRINLLNSQEDILASLSAEKRKSLRKAEKDNVIIKLCPDYGIVKSLVLKTFGRKEKSINQEMVDKILNKFANVENSFAFVAYLGEAPVACTFCVYDKGVCYYLFGGYDSENKHHGAGPSCMWHAIKHAKSLGIKVYDFEGSMLPEVERYFRDFGGELVPYFTIQKAWLPVEMLLKIKMRNRF